MVGIIGLIVFWNIVGGFIEIGMVCHSGPYGAIAQSYGLEFVNPVFVYKHNKVNWFGAIMVATVYGLICPIATLCYWIYKLCTVGRK